MKQAVVLIAILAVLSHYVSADEINDSNPDEGEDVVAMKIESSITPRLGQLEGDRFIISLWPMNWFAAYGFCSQQNATLLSLELGPYDFKKQFFRDFNNMYHLQYRGYWLSGNRLEDDVTFRWGLGGVPVSYTDWNPGQPDNARGTQRCMRLFSFMTWDDEDCVANFYAACQKY
ncbi:C-type lectin 37Db isoform X1 [Zeugodacus cucurbitae]|uniref:C-type lectin 37Db isoform X1 n=1 Tax=Zeugodacus cucurbitae TaxID=28588 RepID=UPI0023D955B4|nr:C-type lectin 37Db isoform X1 [Zeugodacus cucurbitae]